MVPVAKVEVSVVGLAIPFVGGADGTTVGDFPGLIADDGLLLAVLIRHFKLQKQTWRAKAKHIFGIVPIGIFGVVTNGRIASSFKDDTDGIVTAIKHPGDIVSVEIDTLGIPGKRRFQQFFWCDFGTIEVGTVYAHAADIQPGLTDFIFKDKILAKISRRQAGVTHQHIVVKLMSNPFRLPILLIQQTDFKGFDLTINRSLLTSFCRHRCDDFPIGFVATMERRACIRDIKHLT